MLIEENKRFEVPGPDSASTAECDSLATSEAEEVGQDELKKQSRYNEHIRRERRKSFLWWISITATGFVVLGIGAMSVIWFIHLAVPQWRWIKEADLIEIKTILFSTIISAIIAPFIKQNLSDQD